GSSFTNSGFSAVIPSSALEGLTGPQTLHVYLHTPDKGIWFRSIGISLAPTSVLAYPKDPIVVIARPQEGMTITQLQKNSTFTFYGWSATINPILLSPDFNTLYVTPLSSITAKQSPASARFQIPDHTHRKIQP